MIMYDSKWTIKNNCKKWCNLTDLMKHADVAKNSALVIKSTINKRLESETYYVTNNKYLCKKLLNI